MIVSSVFDCNLQNFVKRVISVLLSTPSIPHSLLLLHFSFRRTLAEDTLMQLSMAHGLTGNVAYLRAKVRKMIQDEDDLFELDTA